MDKIINLESIILESYGCEDACEFQNSHNVSMQMIKEICIEAIKQALELAAENATLLLEGKDTLSSKYVVESGNYYNEIDIDINQQSILDTINQIE